MVGSSLMYSAAGLTSWLLRGANPAELGSVYIKDYPNLLKSRDGRDAE